MFRKLWWAGMLSVLSGLCACSASNPNVRVRRLESNFLEVDGPLAGPFKTLEELAQSSCELMTNQPGASNGSYGFEYCALHYYSASGGGFFLSYLSNVSGDKAGGAKYCEMPRTLKDSKHGDAVVLGGDHTHPYSRAFSKKDMSSRARWTPVRFVDPVTRQIRDRDLMVFFRERTGACKAYNFNNATQVITALREGQWVPIGKADDAGDVQMFEGRGWSQ